MFNCNHTYLCTYLVDRRFKYRVEEEEKKKKERNHDQSYNKQTDNKSNKNMVQSMQHPSFHQHDNNKAYEDIFESKTNDK